MTNCAELSTPSGIFYGMKWDTQVTDFKQFDNNAYTAYFNYSKDGRTAGARIDYDNGFKTKVGLRLDHEDHTWKFRFHNTGMMHAMLKWRLHRSCAAHITTNVNLKDVPAGKINSIPLGLGFQVEY
jgi:hypothetical protein